METIGSKRSYALIWCMPNNDDDEYHPAITDYCTVIVLSDSGSPVFTFVFLSLFYIMHAALK